MRFRQFGNTALTVSEVGFGCARIGGVFQGSSKQELLSLLQKSFDAGITFYDTADMYAQGESEKLLGAAFGRSRDKVVIASKVGYRFPSQLGLVARIKPLLKPLVSQLGLKRQRVPSRMLSTVSTQDFSPAYITRMVDESLGRLQSDYLDIYQLHSPPREVLERGEFVATLNGLQQQGKIRCWGVACEHPEDALICLEYAGIASIQVSLSLLHRDALELAIPRAAERGVGVIARQVFASGSLTKSVEYENAARAQGQSVPEMALGFVLAQPGVSVALLGMHRQEHLDQCARYF